MDFMKKYYNAMVGVAIVGVFVLGLTISGSASNILASISDVVGGQQAQVSSLCRITDELYNDGNKKEQTILLKYLHRNAYTPYGGGSVPIREDEYIDGIPVKNAIYYYQKDAGLVIRMGSDGRPDPIVDTATRTHINSRIKSTDCTENTLPYKILFADTVGIEKELEIGESLIVDPGSDLFHVDPNNGEKTKINVLTIEKNSDSDDRATAAEGYSVSAIIYKDNSGPPPASRNFVNGITTNFKDRGDGVWSVDLKAPTTPGKYVLRILLRCAVVGSKCDLAYGKDKNSSSVITRFEVSAPSDVELLNSPNTVFKNVYRDPAILNWKVLNPDVEGVVTLRFKWLRKYETSDPSYDPSSPVLVRQFNPLNTSGSHDLYLPKNLMDGVWDVEMILTKKDGNNKEAVMAKNGPIIIDTDI